MKMSLCDFATLVGVSVSSVKRWESGNAKPSEAQREAIFGILTSGERYVQDAVGLHPGWWLRLTRHTQGVSIRHAAELCSVSPSTWHRFESGQSKIGFLQAQRLSQCLGEQQPSSVLTPVDQPYATGKSILTSLLGQSTLEPTDSTCQDLATLAQALMQIGDHDLCGQANLLAYTLGKRLSLDSETLLRWRLSSLWIGFPAIKATRFASMRLSWLEHKLSQASVLLRADYGIVRAMFLDWSGYPTLAREMLERPHDSPGYEELAKLMLAWFEAKYGDPSAALRKVENCFEGAAANNLFLARKVAFEACLQLEDFRAAQEHYAALEGIRIRTGCWSPDLSARRKGMGQALPN